MQKNLDCLLSSFSWYRRLVGGKWTPTLDLPMVQGGFVVWWRGDAPQDNIPRRPWGKPEVYS